MNDDTPLSDAELTRLADGSLPESERERLGARVNASPELRARLDEQSRAVSLVRRTDEIVAPASLRASVQQLAPGEPGSDGAGTSRRRARAARRWRPRLYIPVAAALAIAVTAVVIAVSASGTPTVTQTARLTLSAATTGPPSPDAADRDLLDLRVGDVPFPSYVRGLGWRASGTRHDTLHGRRVTTVFYRAGDGTRVGYAIVGGKPLTAPSGTSRTIDGVRYVLRRVGPARLVTWVRGGHTCVIAGRSVGDRTLLALATADERTTA